MYFLKENNKNECHAGSKARIDAEDIMLKMNIEELKYCTGGKKDYIYNVFKRKQELKKLNKDDIVIFQYPYHGLSFNLINRRINKIKNKNIKAIAIIHDLLSMRPAEIKYDIDYEIKILNMFDGIIVHNEVMYKFLVEKGLNTKVSTLGIFDYLSDKYSNKDRDYKNISIAGNLSEDKSKYIYTEEFKNIKTNIQLYGPNFNKDREFRKNIKYIGCFDPEVLGEKMKCGFGLVWDGDSVHSCSGKIGEYLRYNNPHKTSMYLSVGMPVIVWRDAAIAKFVNENKLGITVNSLNEVDFEINNLTLEKYMNIKRNCEIVSEKIRNGYFLETALKKIIKEIK